MTDVDLVRLAERRGRLAEAPSVDPVTAEVIRNSMETVCFEMAQYVSRTATTPSGGIALSLHSPWHRRVLRPCSGTRSGRRAHGG